MHDECNPVRGCLVCEENCYLCKVLCCLIATDYWIISAAPSPPRNWLLVHKAYFPFFLGMYLGYISQITLQVDLAM